eukprot:704155-Rhodomonas_salina.2
MPSVITVPVLTCAYGTTRGKELSGPMLIDVDSAGRFAICLRVSSYLRSYSCVRVRCYQPRR